MIKYTEEVKRVLKTSEKEMLKLSHNFVGTEHLILAILNTDNEIKPLLNNNMIYYNDFKTKLIKYIHKGESKVNNIIYTPLLKRILLNVNKEDTITLKDIMISFLEEGEGIGITLLNSMNLDLKQFYKILKNKPNNIKYGINLNEEVIKGNITRVINRDKEINELIESISRKNKCNPLLIGKAGTGKTAIVEGLAYKIVNKDVPKFMLDKQIINISLSSIVSGTRYRGEFEEKLHNIIKHFESNPNLILFIDEIHTLVGAGGAEGAIDASNILKPYLARNSIKCIGATTEIEYKKSIQKDKALNRRFQKILVNEPNEKETKFILKSIKNLYESFHNVTITDKQIDYIVEKANKEITSIANPDKSLDILDEVCTKTSIYDYEIEISKLNLQLKSILDNKENSIINKNYIHAKKLKIEENKLKKEILEFKPKVKSKTIEETINRRKNKQTNSFGFESEFINI